MSRDEIIAMATEAGLNSYRIAPGEALAVWGRFAALVAAKEREACATECESISRRSRWVRAAINGAPMEACQYAAAIRSRLEGKSHDQ